MFRRLTGFFREDLWRVDVTPMPWPARLGIDVLRIVVYVLGSYDRHQIGVRASGLALVSLLSVVPMAAIAFGIAGGLGYRDQLETAIQQLTANLPQRFEEVVIQLNDLVLRTNFHALGLAGTGFLLVAGMSLYSRTEQALNFAWRSRASSDLWGRVSHFLMLLVLVPVLMLVALVGTSALHSDSLFEAFRQEVPLLLPIYEIGLWLVPHVFAWFAFTALFKFLPAVRVRWGPALVAGILVGSGLIVMHGLYLSFQVGVARANAIYATLAALPLLLIYLQTAWTIVLFGAEVSYAIQNNHLIDPEQQLGRASQETIERLALRLTELAIQHFDSGKGALRLNRAAQKLEVPTEWLDQIAESLVEVGILLPVTGGGVAPARAGAAIDAGQILVAVRGRVPLRLQSKLRLADGLEDRLHSVGQLLRDELRSARFGGSQPQDVVDHGPAPSSRAR